MKELEEEGEVRSRGAGESRKKCGEGGECKEGIKEKVKCWTRREKRSYGARR